MAKAIRNWLDRHRNRYSFWLHVVGMPACFVAAPVLLLMGRWGWAAGVFAAGYAAQFIGHLIEGNRSGEEILLRRLLRRAPGPGKRAGPG